MQHLCSKCRNYLVEGNDTWCRHDMWEGVTISKSKIYNPFMFECIEWEKKVKFDRKPIDEIC